MNDMVEVVDKNDCPVVDKFTYQVFPGGSPDSVNVTMILPE